ncbi:MAG: alpha/beta hydrolase [Hyphomicrobiaceae bacterium]
MARNDLVQLAKNPVPSGATVGLMKAADGLPLRYAVWQASRGPKRGTVCLFGGRTEFIEKYFEVVADLRRRGFAVATMDWRGQGGSGRMLTNHRKGYVRDFAQFDADLLRFMKDVVLPDCPPPFVALAHSMGGNIILRSAAMPGCWFEKIVLSAPMVRLNPKSLRWGLKTTRMMTEMICAFGGSRIYVPGGSDDYGETWPFEGNTVTTDRERYNRNNAIVEAAPDLGLGAATFGWLRAALRSMELLHGRDYPARVHVPILFAIAGEDRIASSRGIEDFAVRLKLARHIVIPHARHEIMQERDDLRQQFWAAFDGFLGIGEAS